MKKTILAVFFVFLFSFTVLAGELKISEKAANFSLKDAQGKIYTLDSDEFKGRVLSIFYVDPDEKEFNAHVETALLRDQALDRNKSYTGLSITNLKATKMPNFIVKSVVADRQEKMRSIILLDYDYTLAKLWGLKKNHSSDLVVLDKDRICRYIYRGKMPPDEVTKAINIIKEYQIK